jgi:tetratricopeptide (TPR) repeat protein
MNKDVENSEEVDLDELLDKAFKTIQFYLKSKDYKTAEAILEQTIKVTDKHLFYQLLSLVKTKMNKYEEAETLYKKLCDDYNNPDDYNNYALFLNNNNRMQESLVYSSKAMELNPEKAVFYSNHALTLTRLNKHDEALEFINTALKMRSDEWYHHANKGCCLAEMSNYEEAEQCFRNAVKIEKCDKEINVDLFHCLAFQKKFKEAWTFYEERYFCYENLMKFMIANKLVKPDNLGEDLEFVVFCEQGAGDNLMYLRFLEEFQQKYKNSYFFCPENFVSIMSDKIKWKPEIDKNTQFGISLLSLPFYLGAEKIPEPYKICEYKKPNNLKKKIGLIWAGNAAAPMDYQRSTFFTDFADNLDFEKHEIYSFQKDRRVRKYKNQTNVVDYSENFEKYKITDLSEELIDVKSTATMMSQMDLIMCIDSLPTHIAGSVGVPTVLFVSNKPDWRWGKFGDSSEWYSNIKIYRQVTDEKRTQSFKETIGFAVKDLGL